MLRSLKDLEGYRVRGTDGDLGTVSNFLLEDAGWACRYMVVGTGGPFRTHEVLIPPKSFGRAEWSGRTFPIALTCQGIRESPGVETDPPVSQQHEQDFYRYYRCYGYPDLWARTGEPPPAHGEEDLHLWSARVLRGYRIHACDGELGHVDDFIVDDRTWRVRYFVVRTSTWWLGRLVLVPPRRTKEVSWDEGRIYLGVTRQEVEDSPAWDASAPVNHAYDEHLFDYYGRPTYGDSPGYPQDPREGIL